MCVYMVSDVTMMCVYGKSGIAHCVHMVCCMFVKVSSHLAVCFHRGFSSIYSVVLNFDPSCMSNLSSCFSFCQSFGEKLELIIHEASHYLPPPTQDPLARKERQV